MASLKNESTSFNNVNVIQIMDYLYTSYGKVEDIEIKKNQVTTMTAYMPDPPMAILTNQLEEGIYFVRAGNQYITYVMMISKGITLSYNMLVLTKDIKWWNRKNDSTKI